MTFYITLVSAIILIGLVMYLTKKYLCPKCGNVIWKDLEKVEDISIKVCSNCGYRKELN